MAIPVGNATNLIIAIDFCFGLCYSFGMDRYSVNQVIAYQKLSHKWQSAFDLGVSIATLDALVRKGLAEKRRDSLGFSPRTTMYYRKKQAHDKEGE